MPAAANQEFARLTRKNQPTGTHNEEWSSLASFVSGANPTGESWPFVKLVSGATANKWFRRLPVHDAAVEDPRFARLTARGADALVGPKIGQGVIGHLRKFGDDIDRSSPGRVIPRPRTRRPLMRSYLSMRTSLYSQ